MDDSLILAEEDNFPECDPSAEQDKVEAERAAEARQAAEDALQEELDAVLLGSALASGAELLDDGEPNEGTPESAEQ